MGSANSGSQNRYFFEKTGINERKREYFCLCPAKHKQITKIRYDLISMFDNIGDIFNTSVQYFATLGVTC